MVLGTGEIRDDLHTPVREVAIGQDRKAGVGVASDNGRFGVRLIVEAAGKGRLITCRLGYA